MASVAAGMASVATAVASGSGMAATVRLMPAGSDGEPPPLQASVCSAISPLSEKLTVSPSSGAQASPSAIWRIQLPSASAVAELHSSPPTEAATVSPAVRPEP